MSAQGFVSGMNETSMLAAERAAAVRARCGAAWPAKHKAPECQALMSGAAVSSAQQPTLLELYRQDPVAVRMEISRLAHRARNEGIRAFCARFFG